MKQSTNQPVLKCVRSMMICLLVLGQAVVAPLSVAAEEVFYYHNDALGSPVAMTDESGAVVWTADYDPFGAEWNLNETEANTHRFTGKELDPETGLHYFGARYYDSALGRFISVDPALVSGRPLSTLTIPQRHNLYAYTTNNPYRYVDPDGRFLETAFDVVSLGLSISEFVQNPTLGNAAAVVLDSAAAALPFVPGGFGLAIKTTKAADKALTTTNVARAVDKAVDGSKVAKGTNSLKAQAADLVPLNNGKHRVTLRSEKQQLEIDLAGKSHAGIPTPHTKVSPRNAQAPVHKQPAYNTRPKHSTVRDSTQQDIRTARKFLERKSR